MTMNQRAWTTGLVVAFILAFAFPGDGGAGA